jgi:iron complex transport system substrate-binding protein
MLALALLALGFARIVSLAPALTEDLFAIGAGPAVVGVDAYSNRPAAARRLPRVGGLREVNAEAVLALRPDLVLGIPYEAPHLVDLERAGIPTRTLRLDGLDDDLEAIGILGRLTGRDREARTLVDEIRRRLAVASREALTRHRLTAFVALGSASLRTAGRGSYIDQLLGLANLENVAREGTLWPTYSAERLLVEQPDVIVVSDLGPPLRGEPWERLEAVRAGRIVRIPEDDLLRPGPRVPDVLDALVSQVGAWR